MNILFAVLRYAVTLAPDIVGWIMVLAIHAMWGRRLFWYKGALFSVIQDESWPRNKEKFWGGWYADWGGTTLTAHAIMLSEGGMNTRTVEHELQHSRQMVVRGFALLLPAVVVAIFYSWWLGLLIWTVSGLLISFGSFFESWTNGGKAYKDNVQEQHARAMTEHVAYYNMDDVLDGEIY
jgi:hypothetical protein